MNSLLETIRAFGMGRIAAMGAVAFGLVGIFAFILIRMSEPDMVPLFTGLTYEDATGVITDLETQNVPFELKNDGSVILVPEDRVLRLRLSFAETGMPTGGVVGYEIFDNASTLGTTSFVQNINRTRALEGELSRTIQAIDRVQIARVHLVQPERQLFSRDQAQPSASIVLRVRGELSATHIRSVQNLVASAVENLKPERVSIVDEAGRLLASGRDSDSAGFMASSLNDRASEIESRLRNQISDIITNVVGPGRARVEVAAELDFNRVTQTSDTYDPDGRVVRSTQTREEASNASENIDDQGVTVGNELPDANAAQGGDDAAVQENATTSEEIVNYEISRTTRTQVTEAGGVKRLSVAVLIDGNYTQTPDGEFTYEPRPQQEIEQIAALVRSAIGFDQARGDVVEVVNLRFAEPMVPPALELDEGVFLGFSQADLIKFAELGVLFLIALLVLLVVVRPLVRRIVEQNSDNTGTQAMIVGPDGQVALTAPDGTPMLEAPDGEVKKELTKSATMEMIEEAKENGDAQATTVKRVGELVKANPDEAVSIIRQLMAEPA